MQNYLSSQRVRFKVKFKRLIRGSNFTFYSTAFNPFSTNVPLLYPLKTENILQFSDVFRGYRSGTLFENGLMMTSNTNLPVRLLFEYYYYYFHSNGAIVEHLFITDHVLPRCSTVVSYEVYSKKAAERK